MKAPPAIAFESDASDDEHVSEHPGPALVPELLVVDLDQSLHFWCGLCGFAVRYTRPAERFAYIELGSAHVMLEQLGVGRNWVTGPLNTPLGRGINFQITVPTIAPITAALAEAGVALFMPPETKRYRVDAERNQGVEQFLVTDPRRLPAPIPITARHPTDHHLKPWAHSAAALRHATHKKHRHLSLRFTVIVSHFLSHTACLRSRLSAANETVVA